MKVLITGVHGYIGSLLAQMLLDRGHDVSGLDVGYYRDGWLYDGVKTAPHCIDKDIRLVTSRDLSEYDALVHLAELSNDPVGQLNPEITYEINHQGSVNLARNCKEAGVERFVYSSSCSVYGKGSSHLVTETSETHPQTAYAKCKILVEEELRTLADDNFSPTILRNATAYGPSPRMRFDLVVNNLAGLAWTSREIKMTSDGTPWRPLVHVLDICQAMACSIEAPRDAVHNQTFNVGETQENYQVKDIAQIVADTFPGCELGFGVNNDDNRSYRVSFDKVASQLPEFRCQWNVTSGANQLRELFERIEMSQETFRFRAYTRLKQLEYSIQSGRLDSRFFWSKN